MHIIFSIKEVRFTRRTGQASHSQLQIADFLTVANASIGKSLGILSLLAVEDKTIFDNENSVQTAINSSYELTSMACSFAQNLIIRNLLDADTGVVLSDFIFVVGSSTLRSTSGTVSVGGSSEYLFPLHDGLTFDSIGD